jgi:ATP-binding cassette subfamily B (MDR/TAP) protein 1
MRQEAAWFDKSTEGSLTTRLTTESQMIQEGISEKFGLFVVCMAQLLSGFITALATNWKLALVIMAATPVMIFSAVAMGYFVTRYTEQSQDAYAQAGSVAEQALSGLRTVYAFSMQLHFVERYNKELLNAQRLGYKRGIALGIGSGVLMFAFFGIYALAFWYGSKLVFSHTMTGPTIVVVLEAIITGSGTVDCMIEPLSIYVTHFFIFCLHHSWPDESSPEPHGHRQCLWRCSKYLCNH